MIFICFVFKVIILFAPTCDCFNHYFLVDTTKNTTESIVKFWDSTGFSPPQRGEEASKFLLSNDVKFNIALISSVPFGGIRFIRIHWLLDLIKHRPNQACDWSQLDELLDWVVSHKLRMGFELMGNPCNILSDNFNKGDNLKKWKEMVILMMKRYIARYGGKAISKWRFETWNEPDLKMYNVFNFSMSEYFNYVNASVSALNEIKSNYSLKFYVGGPAGLFKSKDSHPLCWGIMNKCNKDPNKCGFDFISFHMKGNESALDIFEKTKTLQEKLKLFFPNIMTLPIINDESDILSGWWRSKEWRGDVRYAAAVCKEVYLFQKSKKYLNLKGISIDNGFLNFHPSYFSQRTLFARFNNRSGNDNFSQFFRKPVCSVMALLGMLKGKEMSVSTNSSHTERVSVIASAKGNFPHFDSISILVFTSFGNVSYNNGTEEVRVEIVLPNNFSYPVKLVSYVLSNNMEHPRKTWNNFGQPVFPNYTERKEMRKGEGPHTTIDKTIFNNNDLTIDINLIGPSIYLLHLCSKKMGSPGQVVNLKAINITYNEVLLLWKDDLVVSKCIKSYIVEFCKEPCKDNIFKRINEEDIIFLYFQYAPVVSPFFFSETIKGSYRVSAEDYWGRKGEFSNTLNYP